MISHTPEPWQLVHEGTAIRGCDGKGPDIARVYMPPGMSIEEHSANARLLVAAPRLLEALREIANNLQEPPVVNADRQQWAMRRLNECLYLARAAIAKATQTGNPQPPEPPQDFNPEN